MSSEPSELSGSSGSPAPPSSASADRPPHFRPTCLLLVFIGGMSGTLARFGLVEALPTPVGLPLGIFLVNIVGAFALGLLLEALAQHGPDEGRRRAMRLLLGTGFLGGFTTYSALAVDSALLLGSGRTAVGIAYLAGSVVVGLLATAAGVAVGSRVRRGSESGSKAGLEFGPKAGRADRPATDRVSGPEPGADASTETSS